MDYTYLDYFNYYLKEYINELINTFPETQEPLLSNYRNLLEGRDDKNDLYAKCFYTKINNYLTHIAKRDVSLFETPGKVFIEGVDLVNVWHNTNATEQSHIAIWKYLQILMILGRKIIPNHKEIVELLQKVSNGDVSIPAKVEKTLSNVEKDETEEPSGVFGLGDIASSLGGLGSIANSLGLGKLADGLGLGGKGNGKDGDGGGGGLGGIGSLVSSITDMFKNPEFTNAMSQLSQTMSSASNAAPATDNNTDAQTPEATSSTNSNTDLQDLSTLDNAPSQQSPEQQNPQMPQLFNNPLFGDLAKELSDTFNFADMEKDGKPQNIGDAMSKFMSGNNPAKLMGLVGKFGNKLQQEVQKGSINPAELLKQTMGAMGGMGGMGGGKDKGTSEGDTMQQTMATMMQQMTQNPQMAQMAQNIAKSMSQQPQQQPQHTPQQATKAHRNKK